MLSTEADVLAGCGDQIAVATSEQIAAATDQLLAEACEPPPVVFGLDAALKRLEMCCTMGLAALPQAEKTEMEAKRQSTSARTRAVKERLQRLHEDAAIPYVGCCANCSGLRLEIPAIDYLEPLWASADDGDDPDDEVDSTIETEGEPAQRRSSRLQVAADTPNYEEEDSDTVRRSKRRGS